MDVSLGLRLLNPNHPLHRRTSSKWPDLQWRNLGLHWVLRGRRNAKFLRSPLLGNWPRDGIDSGRVTGSPKVIHLWIVNDWLSEARHLRWHLSASVRSQLREDKFSGHPRDIKTPRHTDCHRYEHSNS